MSSIKPLVLYGGVLGPNPSKVAMILKELAVPFTSEYVPMTEVKNPSYTKINPNGRLPSLHDPNTGLTIWESGAIIEYAIEKYDTEHKLSFEAGTDEYWLCKQWLYFQVSGQGPYYGQAWWFQNFHPEKLLSAIKRYRNEIKRVSKVLDGALEGREWLVGDRITYADIAFLPWQQSAATIFDEGELVKECPNTQAWVQRIAARPAIKGVLAEKAERTAVIAARMKKEKEEKEQRDKEEKK